jgi:para-aminobenzoate N-oxygenase AurF
MARIATETLTSANAVVFAWDYEPVRPHLHDLYEKAKRDQWNGADALDWSIDVDPERENVPDLVIGIYGTEHWERLTQAEVRKLRREFTSWLLSQFLHGEQGALLAASQLVTAVPDLESKAYASTQVVDEARHVEVYQRYLREKVGQTYPINSHLRRLLRQVMLDDRWDMKFLGMQILVEGLALAAFGLIQSFCQEPLLKDLTLRVMRDEARHVAFGVYALRDHYTDMGGAELRDREDFVIEGCRLMRDRFLAEEVWEAMGMDVESCKTLIARSPSMMEFRRLLFSKIVPNVKRLGLLTPRVQSGFSDLGIMQYEELEASA